MKINIRDQRNGNWYWVARTIYQDYASKIGVIGLALYNAYASYAFDRQKVFPSQTTIAKKLNISIPSLIRYNKILVKYKLIRIHRRQGEANIVTLLYVEPLNLVKGGTKPPLGVPLNLVKGNKNKRIRIKNNIVAKKGDGANLSLFGISNNGQNQFDVNCYNRLIKILQSKRKIFRKVNINNWICQFKKLRVEDKIEKRRIKKVLVFYTKHFGERYIPKAYSAKSFRDKFPQIEDAIDRNNKNYKPGDPEDDFSTKTVKRWTSKSGKKMSRVEVG